MDGSIFVLAQSALHEMVFAEGFVPCWYCLVFFSKNHCFLPVILPIILLAYYWWGFTMHFVWYMHHLFSCLQKPLRPRLCMFFTFLLDFIIHSSIIRHLIAQIFKFVIMAVMPGRHAKDPCLISTSICQPQQPPRMKPFFFRWLTLFRAISRQQVCVPSAVSNLSGTYCECVIMHTRSDGNLD